jgi:hypothetical protein
MQEQTSSASVPPIPRLRRLPDKDDMKQLLRKYESMMERLAQLTEQAEEQTRRRKKAEEFIQKVSRGEALDCLVPKGRRVIWAPRSSAPVSNVAVGVRTMFGGRPLRTSSPGKSPNKAQVYASRVAKKSVERGPVPLRQGRREKLLMDFVKSAQRKEQHGSGSEEACYSPVSKGLELLSARRRKERRRATPILEFGKALEGTLHKQDLQTLQHSYLNLSRHASVGNRREATFTT